MKRVFKILMIIVASVVVACTIGLIVTGAVIGWGPFGSLHNWNQEVSTITDRYPVQTSQKGIIFYGASNFRLWQEMEQDLADYHVQNHGFGGCTDKDLYEYADTLLYPYNPSIVFFQTGSNDYVQMIGTDEKKVEACMAFKKQMFTELHQKMPEAKFVVMSGLLLPGRSKYTALTQKVNAALEAFCAEEPYMHYVDAEKMTFDGQTYALDLFVKDGLHLNHTGQLMWMEEYIKPMIEQLIEEHELDHVRVDG